SEEATCTIIVQVQNEGGRAVKRERPIYSLDVILSVGYRVNSKRGNL
ncbi:MAG: virulence RhuM family protein, partial [Bacilli bacterium]|nr:virulence RhuM family protein [Bacilli bacterium]